VQEGLRLREGTNECVDRGLFTPGISYDDLKNERKSEVHHAELRRHYHWHGTVSKQILGASFLGLEGDEVIHCVLDIMYAKAPYTVIQRAMHIHPTVSEFIPTMMDQLKPLR
jgi:uncharacterized membrane protein YecN with MAPEG domain